MMSVSTSKSKQLIRNKLFNTDAIQALVGAAVYSSHPNTLDKAALPMPCIIIDPQSGDMRVQKGLQSQNMHIYAYSRISQDEADKIYNLVVETLHMERLYDTTTTAGGDPVNAHRGVAREMERPQEGYNQAVAGWYSRGTWRVMTAG